MGINKHFLWLSLLTALVCLVIWHPRSTPPAARLPPTPDKIVLRQPSAVAQVTQPRPPAPAAGTSGIQTPAVQPADPQAALLAAIRDGLNSTNEAERAQVFTHLLVQLVALNPQAAASLAEATAPASGREEVLRRVAELWSQKDPQTSLAWATRLPDAKEQQDTLADVLVEASQTNPALAVNLAKQCPALKSDAPVLPALVQQWAEKDYSSAVTWTANQPAGATRDQMFARIALVESKTNPQQAGLLVTTQIPPGPVQEDSALSVLHQWAVNDPSGALDWVETFPDGPLKNRALSDLSGFLPPPASRTEPIH